MSEQLVSILLPVYNAGEYLKQAIESILNQSYQNFEFIIINDGSTDNSEKVVKSFTDKRIQYVSQTNIGLAATLNKGLGMSKGIYIARQDQDDISHPDRLKKQVEFLENHKEVILLGTRAKVVSDNGDVLSYHDHATDSAVLKLDLLFDNCFVHSSVMFRKEVIESIGKYSTDKAIYEDYELWSRFSEKGNVANLREVMVDYRHHDRGLSKVSDYFNVDAVLNQSQSNIEKFMGRKDIKFDDLTAVYHFKDNRYQGTSISDLKEALNKIATKLEREFPTKKELIRNRCDSYFKVIRYKLNSINRKRHEGKLIKQILLRLEMKLHESQTHITND